MKPILLILALSLLAGCVGPSPDLPEARTNWSPEDEENGPPDHEWVLSDDTVLLYTNRTEDEGPFAVHHRAEAQNSEDPWESAVNPVGSIANKRGYNGGYYWQIHAMGHTVDLPDPEPSRADEYKVNETTSIWPGPQYFILHSSGSNSHFTIPADVNVTEVARDHSMYRYYDTGKHPEDWDSYISWRAPYMGNVNFGSITISLENEWGLAVIRVVGQYFDVSVEPTDCRMHGIADHTNTMFVTAETDMVVNYEQAGRGLSAIQITVFDLPVAVERPECELRW